MILYELLEFPKSVDCSHQIMVSDVLYEIFELQIHNGHQSLQIQFAV